MTKANIISVATFQKTIWDHYRVYKRDFPWRRTKNPYRIFVSEIMLQQTQTERVIEKYNEFIRIFPDFSSLAKASLAHILKVWSGLGYNRRALYIKQAAKQVVQKYNGKLSRNTDELEMLPGIGSATAASIFTFSFNLPTVFIETNIRSVFLHFFFQKRKNVSDTEIFSLVEKTLDKNNPREWYFALMDFGAMLKKKHGNPNKKSIHYNIQSPFRGSDREARGAIIKLLTKGKPVTEFQIIKNSGMERKRIIRNLEKLIHEGFIVKVKTRHTLT